MSQTRSIELTARKKRLGSAYSPRKTLLVVLFAIGTCYRLVVFLTSWSADLQPIRPVQSSPLHASAPESSLSGQIGLLEDEVPEGALGLSPIKSSTEDDDAGTPWLVGILPVTETSFMSLELTITSLLDAPGILNEVVLLSPPTIHRDLRDVLARVFPEDSLDYVDISISEWPIGLGEGAAVLHVARQVSADRFLLMDSSGLSTVDAVTRKMLIGPFSTPLPVGPRGFNDTGTHFQCIFAQDKPQASAFLLPPFSVSSLLVPPHDLEPNPVYDIWSGLGRHISRARFERVGGIVIGGNASLAESWCSGSQPRPQIPSFPQLGSLNTTTDESNPNAPADISKDGAPEVPSCPTCNRQESLTVVLPGFTDVLSFGSAICPMQSQGYDIRVFVADEMWEDEPRSKQLTISPGCEIQVTILRSAQTDNLSHQLSTSDCIPQVILLSGLEDSVTQGQVIAMKRNFTDTVIVDIPRAQLPFCDWMGSLTVEEWRNWHVPRVDISIITNDRSRSLSRLLTSLSEAFLFGDTLDLRINIEQTADEATLDVVNSFVWDHGSVFIHRRVIHGGLLPAVVESWYPSSNHSYGLMLEDDVELSPLFYAWIKMSLLRYRYGRPEDNTQDLFGISLYQQKNLELRPEGRHRFNARSVFSAADLPHPQTPFLSQIPCSWGAVYFPEHWRTFHEYLAVRLSGALPLTAVVAPGVRSNRWTRSWKKYFIELVFLRGHVMLYPNFAAYRSLSTNHLEVGAHVRAMPPEAYERKRRLYRLPLLQAQTPVETGEEGEDVAPRGVETGLLDLPMGSMPAWGALPVTDLFGLLTSVEALKERGALRRDELFGCGGADPLNSPSDVRELLCFADNLEDSEID